MSDAEDDARMAGSDEEDEEESDEDSMDEGECASDRDLAAVMALEQSLQSHPADYGLHAQYVALLRRCKLRGRLREACEAQAALFPLTEQQWRDWIDDEIAAAERCVTNARMMLHSAAQGPAIAVAVPRKRIPNPGCSHLQRRRRGPRGGVVRARRARLLVCAFVGVFHRGACGPACCSGACYVD
jgi:hypothetical protein